VTPIAAHSFDPHATLTMGEGTYVSFTGVTIPDTTVANHGADPFMPPTTHRSSVVQARVSVELDRDATFDQPERAKFFVRTIRQPVESLAKPRHLRKAQFSDVSEAHVTVDAVLSVVHGVSPSSDAAMSIPFDELTKLATQRLAEVHDSDVAVSAVGTPTATGADHETPPSFVKTIREPLLDESSIAHVLVA
jgi:hypothetical protein